MTVQSSKSIKLVHPTRYMLIGPPTGGKTHLACTFPKPFVFDFEDGIPRIGGAGLEFDYETFDYNRDDAAADKAKARLMEFSAMKRAGKLPYRTCVIDSLVAWSNATMASVMRMSKLDKPSQKEFGELANEQEQFKGFAVATFDYLVIIAHEEVEKDEVSGALVAKPLALGKAFSKGLPPYMSEIWFCDSQIGATGRKFTIKTVKDTRHPFLRTAVKGMPPVMEDATFEKIAKLGGFWEPAAVAAPAAGASVAVPKVATVATGAK